MILFIDDELKYISDYLAALRDGEYEVAHVSSTDKAWTIFNESREYLDLVIMDVMMPPGDLLSQDQTNGGHSSGVVLYRMLRAAMPNLPILLLTNRSEIGPLTADDLLQVAKKYETEPSELVSLVNDILKKSESEG